MKKHWYPVVAALVAGCAQQPVAPPLTPQPALTPQQTDAHTRADLHTQLGAGYYELRNFAVALQELNEALRADPNHGPAYNMLGLVYMELREDAAAEQNFAQALRINPLDSDANNNYGWFASYSFGTISSWINQLTSRYCPPVPEPTAALAFATGLLVLSRAMRRRS